jgi:hypothetical protein
VFYALFTHKFTRSLKTLPRGVAAIIQTAEPPDPTPLLLCSIYTIKTLYQADARGAAQVLGSGAQAVTRGAARSASQVLGRGAKAVARSAARYLSQVLDRGAEAVACGAAR